MARAKTGKKKRDWPVLVTTVMALMLLSAEVASVGWRIFKPAEQTVTTETQDDVPGGIGPALSLFGVAPESLLQPKTAVDTANIKVYGVFAGKKQSSSYALFLIDGDKREVYGIGQEVVPGLQLTEVGANHVVLKGAKGELNLPIIEEKTGSTTISTSSAGSSARSSTPTTAISPQATNRTASSSKQTTITKQGTTVQNAPAPQLPTPKNAESTRPTGLPPAYRPSYMQDTRG